MNACTIREATLADYSDVLAIGDINHGMDYLPDMYEDFVQKPDCHSFVCLVNGEIIGFLAAYVTDGATAFVVRGARVKEAHQGRGYFKALNHHINTRMSSIKTVRLERILVVGDTAEKFQQPGSGYDFLCVQVISLFDIPEGVGQGLTSELQCLTLSDLEVLFSCPHTRNSLFPDGYFCNISVPFGAEAVNAHKLFGKRTVMYRTKSITDDYTLLSIGNPIKLRRPGFRYVLDFYGIDACHFKSHVLAHVAYMRTISRECFPLTICTHRDFPEDQLKEIVNLGGIRKPWPPGNEYTFQRQLQA